MHLVDLEKGLAVAAGVEATQRAGVFVPWLARWFGVQRLLNHLGFEHRLSLWRGTWYHTGIKEVA